MSVVRCPWCGNDPLYIAYHDQEWGVLQHDERRLFEMLVLEGAQAGLSWRTILRKRENYRQAFHGFDPEPVARFGRRDLERLLADAGIVRNRAKLESAIGNARALLRLREAHGSFQSYVWGFVGHRPQQNAWKTLSEIPKRTQESDALSKDLKSNGFTFVGSTICYAFMQAVGMVNDHTVDCFRYLELAGGETPGPTPGSAGEY
jgi:DNA-3-methyladenine glycosylase I